MTIAIITEAGVRKVAPMTAAAQAAAASAALSAGIATAVAQGRYYASYAAGNAATTTGQYFAVFTGGNYSFHVNGNATPVFVMPKVDTSGNMTLTGAGNQVFNMTGPKADFGISVDGTNNAGGTTITYSWVAGGQGPLKFANASGEVARFDPAGNFGLGVSPAVRFHVKDSGGASEIARFETTTARGSGSGYLSIYDPTGRKCYIGYGAFNDSLTLVNEMNGPLILGTNANYRWQVGASGNFEPLADNTYQIGYGAARPSVLFAATGTINTSDEREKTWRGEPSADELRAAKRIIAELGFFQWNDAIAEKGDDARYHFGPRAQQVWAIMADEGLIDPIEEGVTPSSAYAFLCYDEWDDDNRFGVRADQLALFLIAAQEARLAALENLITEGE